MADLSVTAHEVVLPLGTELHEEGFVQNLFTDHRYEIFKREADSTLYGCLRETRDPRRCLCDLVLVRVITSEKIDETVSKIDALAEQVRREILRGKFAHRELTLQRHSFMRLHRPLIQYSYQRNGKVVGFHIRPVLLVWDYAESWDYYMGATTRVDVLSIKRQKLNYYLREHAAVLQNLHLSDLKKYNYSKIARRLIRFGHYPIILLWLCLLGFTIGQAPFPLDLTAMVLLTVFPYLGMVGTVYLLHQRFAQRSRTELQEAAPFQSHAHQGLPPAPARSESPPRLEVVSEDPPTVPQLQEEVLAPHRKELHPILEETPGTKLHQLVREFVLTQELDAFTGVSTHLVLATLQLAVERSTREVSKTELTLTELLKLVRRDPTFNPYFRPLSQWARKLEAQTPFEQAEMVTFKRFLLQMLYELQLLPSEIVEGMQKNGLLQTVPHSTPVPPPPTPTPLKPLPKVTATQRPMAPPSAQICAPTPSVQVMELPKPEPPDLEVDSQAVIDLPEINGIQYKQICTRDPNGILCILLVDKQTPQIAEVTQQFKMSIKDWDIQVYFADSTQFEEPSLARELAEVALPVVVVRNGMHRQVLPYHGTQDDGRLHSVLNSYLHRQAEITERRERLTQDIREGKPLVAADTNEEEERDSDPLPEPALISLKVRQEAPPLPSTETTPKDSVDTKLPSEDRPEKAVESKLLSIPPFKEEVAPLPVEPVSQLPLANPERQYDSSGHELADPDFDTSLPDSPKQNPAWKDLLVLVDGMNLSFLFKDYQEAGDEPRLECIFLVVRTLLATGFLRDRVVVYFDANIEERFKECKRYGDLRVFKTYTNAQRVPKFRKVPGGIKADTALVALGNTSKRYIVVTNDGLRGYSNARRHRVGVALDHQTNPLLLVESEEDLSQIAQGIQKKKV